jgi:putative SOS response-associated peptidase YedK
MCGRYQRRADKQRIAEAFHLGNVDGLALELAPDYNASPGSIQPVIVWDDQFGMRTLSMMFWKFLPPYVTDPKKVDVDTILARGDKLLKSSMWRESFQKRRCLVPVDSFIEWQRPDEKTKLPWMFAMKDDELFAVAGIWRLWYAPDGKSQIESFAIITTEPNELMVEKTGHDRMPAIIKRPDYQRWLEPGDPNRPPIDLIRPFDSDRMKAWRVDRRLNNVRNNEASLCDPVEDDLPAEKPKPTRKPKSKPRTDESGQLGMF